MPIIARPLKVVTCRQKLPPITSHHSFITRYCEVTKKKNTNVISPLAEGIWTQLYLMVMIHEKIPAK